MHDDLTTALMIFELVTFAKVKLHPPSSMMTSAIRWVMTRLDFVPKVDKLERNDLGKLGGGT
jgi:hypothetical protein